MEGNNNESAQLSKIDLGQCEEKLRDIYDLDENIELIIVSLEKVTNISFERNLQFEVYESLNKTRLNLSVCKDKPIDIYFPLELSEELNDLYNELKDLGYDLFNINDKFYQDICTPYKSSNNTDVLLVDRINDYYKNDETQCQPGCTFSDYSFETKSLKCYCNVESSEINLRKVYDGGSRSLYKSFYDVLKYSNYKVLKCYKLAFRLINFTINYGCILSVIYFVIYLIFSIVYFIKGTEGLKKEISRNIFDNQPKINNEDDIKIHKVAENNKGNQSDKELKTEKIRFSKFLYTDNNEKSNNNILKSNKTNKRKSLKNKVKRKSKVGNYPPRKKSVVLNSSKNVKFLMNKEQKLDNKNNLKEVLKIPDEINRRGKPTEIPAYEEKEKLDNFELNNLEYREALKLDKRGIIEIYWSILKREHLIIFTFFIRNDHNIIHVKISRLFFLICTDMALNVFFFTDETMHKMYVDYGKYNFAQQIPQIIYSTIVSQIIQVFLCFLSLTDKHYYQVKNLDNKNRKLILAIFRCIKLKIIFFYIFTFIMFIFYWYTISCFCAVYQNTQIIFIKDSLSSFGLGLIYPFALYLFPAVLRTISLKFCLGKLSIIYKLSDIIPFF